MSKYDGYDSYENREDVSNLERIKIFFVKNRKKNLKALIIAIILIILIVALMVGAYLIKTLNLINREDYEGDPDNTNFSEENAEGEEYDADPISDVVANSIDQYCIQWAQSGDKLKSSNVINILLIGRDAGGTNSDTIIIASVNTKAKTITLCSVMRDSYTYSNINGSARCDKINHTYAWGGASALKTTLEDDLKITIDHYACVDFDGFRDMIDELGGVDVAVTEAEAKYMNRTTQMGGFTSGDSVHLDGKHALVFARIRKLDSDINRTYRQRLIIASVINKLKNSSVSQLNNLVNKFLPYITTDCSNSEILSYASKAISGGWLKFEINEFTEPGENYRKEGMMTTYSSRTSKLFVWIVDWALVAKEVQTAIYGESNIIIDEATHQSPLNLLNSNGTEQTTSYSYTTSGYNSYSNTYSYGSDSNTNYYVTDYGEDNYYSETTEETSSSVHTYFDYNNYTGLIPDFTRPTASQPEESSQYQEEEPYSEPSEETVIQYSEEAQVY